VGRGGGSASIGKGDFCASPRCNRASRGDRRSEEVLRRTRGSLTRLLAEFVLFEEKGVWRFKGGVVRESKIGNVRQAGKVCGFCGRTPAVIYARMVSLRRKHNLNKKGQRPRNHNEKFKRTGECSLGGNNNCRSLAEGNRRDGREEGQSLNPGGKEKKTFGSRQGASVPSTVLRGSAAFRDLVHRQLRYTAYYREEGALALI